MPIIYKNLDPICADQIEAWIEENQLTEHTLVIQGPTHDDYLVSIPEGCSVSELVLDGFTLEPHSGETLMLTYGYVDDGLFGPIFLYTCRPKVSEEKAEDFRQRWEESMDDER